MTLRPAGTGLFERPYCTVPDCRLPYRKDATTGGWSPACRCHSDPRYPLRGVSPMPEAEYYNVGPGPDWGERFAYVARLLINHPRDERGHYVPFGEKWDAIHDWLDEYANSPRAAPSSGAVAWLMVAFGLSEAEWMALERVLDAPPTDETLSSLLQKLLNAYLVQQYALPQ